MHPSSIPLMLLGYSIMAAVGCDPIGDSRALSELPPQQEAAFEWFDSLGYPSFRDLQPIRIECSWVEVIDAQPEQKSYLFAFLISEDKPKFSVIGLDLNNEDYDPEAGRFSSRVSFEKVELNQAATEYLRSAQEAFEKTLAKNSSRFLGELQFGPHLMLEQRLFVLSRACAAKGQIELSIQLYELGEQLWKHESEQRRDHPKKPRNYQEAMYDGIAHKEIWQAVVDFGDPTVSRPELLKRIDRIYEHFPQSEDAQVSLDMAKNLEKMITEDLEHKKNSKPFAEMTRKERIADLIFRLRDQNGQQWSQPGSCDVFADGNETNPATQLVEMGFDAIPSLIDNIANDRYSRSVEYHRNFYFSHRVLTVGECTRAVIERIASRSFGESRTESETRDFKRNALAWWDEVKEKGEERVLIEAVEKADRNSPAQADLLAKRYPQSALGAIVRATGNTDQDWVRRSFIVIAGTLEGDTPVLFLREQMKGASLLSWRVAAAKALLPRERNESLQAMLGEWNSLSKESTDRSGLSDLIELLASSDSPEIIQALSAKLSLHSIDTKIDLIRTFVPAIDPTTSEQSTTSGEDKPNQRASVEADRNIEELLVLALEDTEQRMGMSGGTRKRSYRNPRVCDMAAHALWSRWPKKYEFDISLPKSVRDRKLLDLKNVSRKEKGLPPLELQKLSVPPPMSVEELRPLWTKLMDTDGATTPDVIVKELESHGLAILPASRTLLGELNEQHPGRKAGEELVGRVSMIIRKVNLLKEHFDEEEELISRLKSLEGNSLTAERFVKTIIDLLSNLPPNIDSFKFSVGRDSDNSGAVVILETTEDGFSGITTSWHYSEFIESGRECILNPSGNGAHSYLVKPGSHTDLVEKYHEAVMKFEMPMEVAVKFSRAKH